MLSIIKSETSLGSSNKGTEKAPEFLLKHGLERALKFNKINYEASGLKKISLNDDDPLVKNHKTLTALNLEIYKTAVEKLRMGNKILNLGGDHSIAIGSMFATKSVEPKAILVYIDAHGDSNSPGTSTSRNMHGMSFATALGDALYEDYSLAHYGYNQAVLLGAKDLDKSEIDYIEKNKIKMFTVKNIIREGIGAVTEKISRYVGKRAIHVSLDIDVVDTEYAPGTGVPNKGGLTYREIKFLTEELGKLNVRSVDLVEINPDTDIDKKTTSMGIELVVNLFGGKWSPYEEYVEEHARIA